MDILCHTLECVTSRNQSVPWRIPVCVILHFHMCDISDMDILCHTLGCVTSRNQSVTWRILVCDMARSYVWHVCHGCVRVYTGITSKLRRDHFLSHVTRMNESCLHMWYDSLSYVWHDSLSLFESRHTYEWVMLTYVIWLTFICVTWLSFTSWVTSHVWMSHAYICDMTHFHMCDMTLFHFLSHVTCMNESCLHMWYDSLSYVWRDSLSHAWYDSLSLIEWCHTYEWVMLTWLNFLCVTGLTLICVIWLAFTSWVTWHIWISEMLTCVIWLTFICVTWLISICVIWPTFISAIRHTFSLCVIPQTEEIGVKKQSRPPNIQ